MSTEILSVAKLEEVSLLERPRAVECAAREA
jgi:hypothetical protein